MSDDTQKTEEVAQTTAATEVTNASAGSTDAPDAAVEVPEKFKRIVEEIEQMSVLELNELVKVFEKRFGVSAAAVAVAGSAASGDVAEEAGASTASIELTDAGAQKIAVIKVVKEVLGLGLKEAKDLVDGVPSVLKEGVAKEEAEEIKKKVEEAGGKVTLK